MDNEVLSKALAWRDIDPDPVTRAELDDLVERADTAELEGLFTGRLEFGTAGLRAPLGVGPNRMNRVVCRQTADGLARALTESVHGRRNPRRGARPRRPPRITGLRR